MFSKNNIYSMKYIKKFNELYDTDEIKSANEIEGMTTGFIDKIKSINNIEDEQKLLYKKIVFCTPQLSICFEKSDSYYYMRHDEENDMIYFCFDNDLHYFEIGFRKDNNTYAVNTVYNDWVDEENSYDNTVYDLPWKELEHFIGNDLLDTLESIGFSEVKSYTTDETKQMLINSN